MPSTPYVEGVKPNKVSMSGDSRLPLPSAGCDGGMKGE